MKLCVCEALFHSGKIVNSKNGTIDINFRFRTTQNNTNELTFDAETLSSNIYFNENVHECLKSLVKNFIDRNDATSSAHVTVHHNEESNQNPTRIPSLKSSHSMENILKKKSDLGKCKANSVDMLDQQKNSSFDNDGESDEYIENGESIELIFISDEFVNKSHSEVIVLDRENDKRRDSLINKKKIVIITDEYKDKVLRNNSIRLTNKNKSSKTKTYSTSFCEDEPDQDKDYMENKKI